MGSSGATLDCWPGCHIFNADAFQEAFYGGYWHLWFQVVGWRSSHTWEGGISPPDKAKVCCRKSWRLCMERIHVAQPWAFHDISLSWMVTDMKGKGAMKFAWVFANWSEVTTATSKFFLPIFYNIFFFLIFTWSNISYPSSSNLAVNGFLFNKGLGKSWIHTTLAPRVMDQPKRWVDTELCYLDWLFVGYYDDRKSAQVVSYEFIVSSSKF